LRKLFVTVLVVITVLYINTFSEIISGTDRLIYNENITFLSGTITKNRWDSTLHEESAYNVYKCTANVESIDVFNAVKMVGTCTYTCHILAIGSPRPFYLSKIPFGSFDFSGELNISDTSKFMKIDTLINDPMVSTSPNCFLPHVILRSTTYEGAKKYELVDFGIFKNRDGKYIVAKFDTVMDVSSDGAPEPQMHSYLKGYTITWYLQNDGSLQFETISNANPIVNRHYTIEKFDDATKTYYDFYGRKIVNVNKCVPQLIIKKNNKSLAHDRLIVNVTQ